MIKRIVISSLAVIALGTVQSQDYHLSQYFVAPQLINPAKSGMIVRDFRAQAGYRNQWAAVSDAFVTSMASYDMPLMRKRPEGSYFGVGGVIVRDKAGASKLGTFEGKGTLAYHIAMSRYSKLSAGVMVGYTQRTIDLTDLAWDSQFNGIGYDPLLDDQESIQRQSMGYLESGIGLNWLHRKKARYAIGYSAFHYGQNQSFLAGNEDKLFLRHVLTMELESSLNALEVTYFAMSQLQSGSLEAMGGARIKYRVGSDSRYTNVNTSSAVMLGGMLRWGDAVIPFVGYEFKRSAYAWLSYDINISPLRAASNLRGGWEVHLVYLGLLQDRRVRLR